MMLDHVLHNDLFIYIFVLTLRVAETTRTLIQRYVHPMFKSCDLSKIIIIHNTYKTYSDFSNKIAVRRS